MNFWNSNYVTKEALDHAFKRIEDLERLNQDLMFEKSKIRNELSSMMSEYHNMKERSEDLENYMSEHIEGKRLGEYSKPEILKLKDNLEARMKDVESQAKIIYEKGNCLDQKLKEGRMAYEIQLSTEYSQKKDQLLNLMVTKAPIQNLLVDKSTGNTQEVYGTGDGIY